MKLNDIPEDILKRYEERCKTFAYLVENEPLPCKCSGNVEGVGLCNVCEVEQILKLYNDRFKIRSNLFETRPPLPCKCPIIEDVSVLFNNEAEDTRCDVCKV